MASAERTEKGITGEIVSADSFGNLITNISKKLLADIPRDESLVTECDGHQTFGLFDSYTEQPPMTLIAIIGDSEMLELAIVNENASLMLGVQPGTKVAVSWPKK